MKYTVKLKNGKTQRITADIFRWNGDNALFFCGSKETGPLIATLYDVTKVTVKGKKATT